MEKLKLFSKKLGIDQAIAYTILTRFIQAGGGLISILVIAKYLSKIEQGYYFTFGSILAIQIFFELGLVGIITQFVAHETAHLKWVDEIKLSGPDEHLSRLSSLLRFCIKWFFAMAFVLVFILLITGYIFFNKFGKSDVNVNWQVPWIILSICTAGSLIIAPILAFFEGLGKVKEVAKIRLVQQVSQLLFLYFFFSTGFKLFSSPLAATIVLIVPPSWILFSYKRNLLLFIWKQQGNWKINYKIEIFPYQWRIALSWISGYFIFQLFNPVLFATEGPTVAGQMGMTLAGLNGVTAISISWINTKIPLLSGFIAKKDYNTLDTVFNTILKQSSLICGAGLLFFISVIFGLNFFKLPVGNRFLPMFPMVLLCVATFVNQIVGALATYLRCHKQEPFLISSIILGLLTAISTFTLGRFFGLNGIVIGYTSLIIFISFPWALIIFKNKRNLWH
nr:hypothetical protein [uncultured Pedobacter sp.]